MAMSKASKTQEYKPADIDDLFPKGKRGGGGAGGRDEGNRGFGDLVAKDDSDSDSDNDVGDEKKNQGKGKRKSTASSTNTGDIGGSSGQGDEEGARKPAISITIKPATLESGTTGANTFNASAFKSMLSGLQLPGAPGVGGLGSGSSTLTGLGLPPGKEGSNPRARRTTVGPNLRPATLPASLNAPGGNNLSISLDSPSSQVDPNNNGTMNVKNGTQNDDDWDNISQASSASPHSTTVNPTGTVHGTIVSHTHTPLSITGADASDRVMASRARAATAFASFSPPHTVVEGNEKTNDQRMHAETGKGDATSGDDTFEADFADDHVVDITTTYTNTNTTMTSSSNTTPHPSVSNPSDEVDKSFGSNLDFSFATDPQPISAISTTTVPTTTSSPPSNMPMPSTDDALDFFLKSTKVGTTPSESSSSTHPSSSGDMSSSEGNGPFSTKTNTDDFDIGALLGSAGLSTLTTSTSNLGNAHLTATTPSSTKSSGLPPPVPKRRGTVSSKDAPTPTATNSGTGSTPTSTNSTPSSTPTFGPDQSRKMTRPVDRLDALFEAKSINENERKDIPPSTTNATTITVTPSPSHSLSSSSSHSGTGWFDSSLSTSTPGSNSSGGQFTLGVGTSTLASTIEGDEDTDLRTAAAIDPNEAFADFNTYSPGRFQINTDPSLTPTVILQEKVHAKVYADECKQLVTHSEAVLTFPSATPQPLTIFIRLNKALDHFHITLKQGVDIIDNNTIIVCRVPQGIIEFPLITLKSLVLNFASTDNALNHFRIPILGSLLHMNTDKSNNMYRYSFGANITDKVKRVTKVLAVIQANPPTAIDYTRIASSDPSVRFDVIASGAKPHLVMALDPLFNNGNGKIALDLSIPASQSGMSGNSNTGALQSMSILIKNAQVELPSTESTMGLLFDSVNTVDGAMLKLPDEVLKDRPLCTVGPTLVKTVTGMYTIFDSPDLK